MADDVEPLDDDDLAPPEFNPSQVADQLLGLVEPGEIEDLTRRHSFVEYLARGFGTYYAGLAVGWSEAQIKKILSDPEMASIISMIGEFQNDTVEFSILRSAQAGNVQAQKMWALAKMPDRGWVEKRTHIVEGQARVDVVHSVKEALMDTLRQEGAIGALHSAATRDVIDVEVDDADG